MRYIGKSYWMKGEKRQAECWYLRAAGEAPHLREPWLDLGFLLYQEKNWDGVAYCAARALEIRHRPRSYICEAESWGSLPHDLYSIALYETGRIELALEQAQKALALEPENERLQKNVERLKNLVEERENGGHRS